MNLPVSSIIMGSRRQPNIPDGIAANPNNCHTSSDKSYFFDILRGISRLFFACVTPP